MASKNITKTQELEQLHVIESLIDEMGHDSYIGITFAGIVDVCRQNIENDFGNSPVADLRNTRQIACEMEARCHNLEKEVEAANKSRQIAEDNKNEWIKSYNEAVTSRNNLEVELEAAQNEIIKLKAKLYDLMTA